MNLFLADEEDNIPNSSVIVHLEKLGIKYRMVKLLQSASELPEISGISSEQAFKTLLLKSKNSEFLLFSLPLIQKADTKKLSIASGLTGLYIAPKSDIALITGFECETVSPFGLRQALPYYVDNQLFEYDLIYLGSGMSGVVIELSPVDLLNSLYPVCGNFSRRGVKVAKTLLSKVLHMH